MCYDKRKQTQVYNIVVTNENSNELAFNSIVSDGTTYNYVVGDGISNNYAFYTLISDTFTNRLQKDTKYASYLETK